MAATLPSQAPQGAWVIGRGLDPTPTLRPSSVPLRTSLTLFFPRAHRHPTPSNHLAATVYEDEVRRSYEVLRVAVTHAKFLAAEEDNMVRAWFRLRSFPRPARPRYSPAPRAA
jgi:hypothetical protein